MGSDPLRLDDGLQRPVIAAGLRQERVDGIRVAQVHRGTLHGQRRGAELFAELAGRVVVTVIADAERVTLCCQAPADRGTEAAAATDYRNRALFHRLSLPLEWR